MAKPLKEREWFGNAYATIAGAISACIMAGKVLPDTPRHIEEQLERAYKLGLQDGRHGR